MKVEKQTVFIKRYPSKGELPKEDDKDYLSNVGMVYFRKGKFYFREEQLITFTNKVEWFMEEIELPIEEDVALEADNIVDSQVAYGFYNGANYILNKLKGGVNDKLQS